MSSADFALTPVIASRDSDEITAVWLVPQLVLLNNNGEGKPLAVPSGGVLAYEDTDASSGYKHETCRKRRTAPENRVPTCKHGVRRASRAVLSPLGFPFGEHQITQLLTAHNPSSFAR